MRSRRWHCSPIPVSKQRWTWLVPGRMKPCSVAKYRMPAYKSRSVLQVSNSTHVIFWLVPTFSFSRLARRVFPTLFLRRWQARFLWLPRMWAGMPCEAMLDGEGGRIVPSQQPEAIAAAITEMASNRPQDG